MPNILCAKCDVKLKQYSKHCFYIFSNLKGNVYINSLMLPELL